MTPFRSGPHGPRARLGRPASGRHGEGREKQKMEPDPRPALAARLAERLGEPVDGASLAFFRAAFGVLVAVNVVRWFLLGKIADDLIEPSFHFSYRGFGWVSPWPGNLPYVFFALVGVLGLCVALGYRYRLTSALLSLGMAQWFLWEKTYYLNHYYLLALLAFLLAVVPAHRVASLDARSGRTRGGPTVPRWSLLLLRFQVAVPYVFAGLAKVNPDWLRAEPMRMWLADGRGLPGYFGPLLGLEATAYLLSYGGLLLDLLMVPALLWRRTRGPAFLVGLVFHALNQLLFQIGVFPLLMIAASTLFFAPSWPRAFGRRILPRPAEGASRREPAARPGALCLSFLALWAAVQLFLPLRHLAYPGDVSWTEEGHRFAWRMKLRDKAGAAYLSLTDVATGKTTNLNPLAYLSRSQAAEMSTHPDMILAFAHHVADLERRRGRDVEIRARVPISLNGRPYQLLLDPAVDLAAVRDSLRPASWILPLETPLHATRGQDWAAPAAAPGR